MVRKSLKTTGVKATMVLAATLLGTLMLVPSATPLMAQDKMSANKNNGDSKPPSKGELVALAADCAGCHHSVDGSSDFSGGLPMKTPMGVIYTRNITPDRETGIGGWTLTQFSDALRKGKSPNLGLLFPAMPYTSYKDMRDEDIASLYDYFMNEVKPVKNKVPETDLGFPFLRPAMLGWNLLFSNSATPPKLDNPSEEIKRGQYLVDVLGHCGSCHTPRGEFFQPKAASAHLGGAPIGGWYAPNISSDKTGIGDWSKEDLEDFFRQGMHRNAVAGGDMGLAVRLSLSRLPDSDISAIASYLKNGPATKSQPLAPVQANITPVNLETVEPINKDQADFYKTDETDGAALFVAACATCHGVNGSLPNGTGPSLVKSSAVRAQHPNNVVQAIASGINLGGLQPERVMPAFKSTFSNEQIAAVASYVRTRFGGFKTQVTESDVNSILAGNQGVPWILKNARWLAWTGIGLLVVGIFVLVGAVAFIMRRRKSTPTTRARTSEAT